MKVEIYYDNQNAFDSQPTPFLSVEETPIIYGGRWAMSEEYTLNGVITGCTFADIFSGKQKLLNAFARDFKTLQIWQYNDIESGIIASKELAEITRISIPQQTWVGVLPYTINIRCYPSGLFSGFFGVLDPKNEWSFEEQSDYVTNVRHTISCRGFNTSSTNNNALNNAKNWVLGKTGWTQEIMPAFMKTGTFSKMCLRSTTENIDRINGVYSVIENYQNDSARNGAGILRYETDATSGENKIEVSIRGQAIGCEGDINIARSAYNSVSPYLLAALSYQKMFGKTDLNPNPLTSGIQEDPDEGRLDFNIVFDNDSSPDLAFDYSVNLQSGANFTAAINGNIIARGGLRDRFQKMKAYASGIDLFNLVNVEFQSFYPDANLYPLNPIALTSGRSESEYKSEISLNATFDNRVNVEGFDYLTYSIGFIPSIQQIRVNLAVDAYGEESVTDLEFKNRAQLSINGEGRIANNISVESGLSYLYGHVTTLFNTYGVDATTILIDRKTSFRDADERTVSFSFTWTFYSDKNVVSSSGYRYIADLGVK